MLIALPLIPNKSFEILCLIKKVFRKPLDTIDWYLRYHPASDHKIINRFLEREGILNRFIFDKDDLEKSLNETQVVISCASGLILEILSKGIPVIVIGSQTELTHNPVIINEQLKTMSVCYTAEQLYNSINRFIRLKRIKGEGVFFDRKRILEACFEPVNSETIRHFQEILLKLISKSN